MIEEPKLRNPYGEVAPPPPKEDPFTRTWSSELYYSPEKCGFTQIAELSDHESWSFDLIVLWRDDATRTYWIGHDSGCSCPSPFEGFLKFSDLTQVRTADEVASFIKVNDNGYNGSTWATDDTATFMKKVREVL